MALKQTPLHYSVPIVDNEGRPTPEFMNKWEAQTRINGSIPELSTATQVSAVLDKIGSTSGQILLRGSGEWGVLSSPGGTTKYLRADGTYATPPNTTYEVVTDSDDGLAPKLSGTATEYLDGSGQWSTPAGGGGGRVWFWLTNTVPDDWTFSNSAHATKGELVTPTVDVVVDGLMFSIRPDDIADTYQASVVALDNGSKITSIVSQSGLWSAPSTDLQIAVFDAAASLDAGQKYGILLTLTSGSGTSICRGFWPADTSFLAAPLVNGGFLTLDDTTPNVGDTFSLDVGNKSAATGLNLSF